MCRCVNCLISIRGEGERALLLFLEADVSNNVPALSIPLVGELESSLVLGRDEDKREFGALVDSTLEDGWGCSGPFLSVCLGDV